MMKKSNIEWCDFTWDPVTGCRMIAHLREQKAAFSFQGGYTLSSQR